MSIFTNYREQMEGNRSTTAIIMRATLDTLKCKVEVKRKSKPYSPYARVFDEECLGWTRDAEMNRLFLLRQQEFANEKLQQRGYLFLNEVYDMLGLSRTKVGQCVGWCYDLSNRYGDNYVDFGIYDVRNRWFVNGQEKTIVLDFNVDGNILDRLEEEP